MGGTCGHFYWALTIVWNSLDCFGEMVYFNSKLIFIACMSLSEQ